MELSLHSGCSAASLVLLRLGGARELAKWTVMRSDRFAAWGGGDRGLTCAKGNLLMAESEFMTQPS